MNNINNKQHNVVVNNNEGEISSTTLKSNSGSDSLRGRVIKAQANNNGVIIFNKSALSPPPPPRTTSSSSEQPVSTTNAIICLNGSTGLSNGHTIKTVTSSPLTNETNTAHSSSIDSSTSSSSTNGSATIINGNNNNNNNNHGIQNGQVSQRAKQLNGHSTGTSTAPTIMRNMDDKWIVIQKNTFTNWVNEQLKAENEQISDLKTDLSNGVRLIKLVNKLQQPSSKIARRYFRVPTNQHQCLENVSLALNAITEDGIKLVNIGNTDLTNGNLKLILGLIWHLILRYQIGKTKIPPKKLILAWIKSVLPNCHLTNLTDDLNDGLIIAYVNLNNKLI